MAEKMQPWMKAAIAVAGDDVLRDIVNDNRNPPRPAAPPSNVSIMGAGRVQDFDVGPKYRPYVPPKEDDKATTDRSGWREAPKIDNWKPPGLREMDAMMDAADLQDRLQRVRQLGEARALVQAEAEIKAQQEELNKKGKGSK